MKCYDKEGDAYIFTVAPARERGLKFFASIHHIAFLSRSREGAWIEILDGYGRPVSCGSRSREGAWIEI